MLQAAYEYHSVYLEILLALFVGLRKGEILGLKYSELEIRKKENMQLFEKLGEDEPEFA